MGLCWKDINWEKGEIHIWRQLNIDKCLKEDIWTSLKTEDSERTLPLIPETWPYFQAVLDQSPFGKGSVKQIFADHSLVICRDDGQPYTPHHATTRHSKLLKEYGLPYVRLHDQRHAAATNVYELTGDMLLVSHLLGHALSTKNATLGYIRFNLSHLRNAMERYWFLIQEGLNNQA